MKLSQNQKKWRDFCTKLLICKIYKIQGFRNNFLIVLVILPGTGYYIASIYYRVNEVLEEPDIMGGLRDAVETFYKRDHVEIIEETQLKEMTFLTDINFTHQMRVSHIRWHPTIPGVLAMSVLENKDFETYLERLTTRIVMTNMLLIWSVAHPLFPQVNVFN